MRARLQPKFFDPVDQHLAFAAQLSAAVMTRKPLFLHCRGAFTDFYEMTKEAVHAGAYGVVHCFPESADEAQAFVDIGLDIGITGRVTDEKRGGALLSAMPDPAWEDVPMPGGDWQRRHRGCRVPAVRTGC
jgi:TatD DNase family protein